jgi:hypothetical protein
MVAAENQTGAVGRVDGTSQRHQHAGCHRRRQRAAIQQVYQCTTRRPFGDDDRDGGAVTAHGFQHIEHPRRPGRVQTSRPQGPRDRGTDQRELRGVLWCSDKQGQRDVTLQHQVAALPQAGGTAAVAAEFRQQPVATLAENKSGSQRREVRPVWPRPRRLTHGDVTLSGPFRTSRLFGMIVKPTAPEG